MRIVVTSWRSQLKRKLRRDCKLLRVEADAKAKGKYNLHFTDDSMETGVDLVVGADGAWSKVRPLVTNEKPFYSDITAIELWALDVDKRNPLYRERTVQLEDSFG